MRTNSAIYNEFNRASVKELRLVVVIDFPSPLYLTSHSSIPSLPVDNLEDVLRNVSSTSQRLVPDEGRSEIGSMSFSVIDAAGAVTSRFRAEQAAGEGLKGRTVKLYRGGAGMDWSDFRLEQTQQIDADVTLHKGAYQVRCADIQRSMRKDIFDLAKTRLAADLAAGASTMTVFDTSAFEACTHVASFGDESSGSFYYLKIKYNNGFEIVKATAKTDTTFTGLTRGMFGTDDVLHELPDGSDADSGVEIEEYVYLELPAPAMAYALLTGNIIGGGTIPSSWCLGIDSTLVDQDSFENIGEDWFDSSDYTKGLIFRFQAITKTDGKRFIEREVCLLAGAFLRVGADGVLYMRRMTGVIGTADHVLEINPDNAITHGAVKHDLSKVRNTFDVQWSWAEFPGEDKPRFLRRNILTDPTSLALHRDAKPLKLQFKGLHAERHTFTTLRNRFDALRDRYAGPPITFPADLMPSLNDLEVGDIVRANFPNVRDYSGEGTLDRACEIQRITVNQRSGRVSAELFASTQKADPIPDDGAGGTAELPDDWYSSEGTAASGVLTIDGSDFVTADGTLNGGTSTRTVYYYLGDLTINSGVTLTISGNVELRVRGHYQNNGTVLVAGGMASNAAGYLGTTFGGRGVLIGGRPPKGIGGIYDANRVIGQNAMLPVIEIKNDAGVLGGIPADMRGSGGGLGGSIHEWNTDAGGGYDGVASGGSGGVGGGSLVIVSRGAGYGVSGETVLSGEDGTTGETYEGEDAGSGGGGAPGCLLHVLDGSLVSVPILAGNVVAEYGTSPITNGNADTQGKAKASDPIDLGVAAARVLYVPKSRSPYPDFENDNFDVFFGKSSIALQIFRRAASTPATPTGGSYNFGTKTLTPPTNWFLTPPASDGNPLHVSVAIFEIIGTTGTDDTATWTAPKQLVSDGTDGEDGTDGDDGAAGNSSIVVTVYQRASSAPSTPTGGSYNFSTKSLAAPLGWAVTPPVPDGDPLYASSTIFEISGTSGTDSTATWTTPAILLSDLQDLILGNGLINPSLETGTLEGWTVIDSGGGTWSIRTTDPRFGTYHLQRDGAAGSARIRNNSRLQVGEGDRVLAQGFTQVIGAGSAITFVRILFRDADGALITFFNGNVVTATEYELTRRIAVAPAGTAVAEFELVIASIVGTAGILADGAYMAIIPRGSDIILDDATGTVSTVQITDEAVNELYEITDDLVDAATSTVSPFGDDVLTITVPETTSGYSALLIARFDVFKDITTNGSNVVLSDGAKSFLGQSVDIIATSHPGDRITLIHQIDDVGPGVDRDYDIHFRQNNLNDVETALFTNVVFQVKVIKK